MTKLKWLNLSDIHLRHPKLTIDFQLTNLRKVIFTDANKDLSLLSIAGDLFDTNLDFADNAVIDCVIFLKELIDYCGTNNIVLRVLEGTPSHDHGQAKIMNELINKTTLVDFKYVGVLSVEIHQKLGISILYVPDECYPDRLQIEQHVDEALKVSNLNLVDIAIMHGQFEYQLPPIARSDLTLSSQFFLDRVKYFIAIGHIHQHNPFGKIVPGGSFDRLCHGDEIPKGCVLFNIDLSTGGTSFCFIENTLAKVFKTINVPSELNDIESVITYLNSIIINLPTDSYVKLEAQYGSIVFRFYKEITDVFNNTHFTRSVLEHRVTKVTPVEPTTEVVQLTKSNLTSVIANELLKNGHNESFVEIAKSVLEEVL